MEYCTNCQKTLPQQKFDLHLGYCRRNIKRCGQCKMPYDINNLQEHNEQFHNVQKCQYCNTNIMSRQFGQHKKNCVAKPIQCLYCEMSIPTDKFEHHKQQCQSRTKTCEKCQKPVVNKQYFEHLGTCKGKVAVQSPYTSSNSNSNTYYSPSYSQPVTYISSQSNSNSQSTSYYQSGTSSNNVYTPSYTSPNVIRTYTRTYIPGAQNQSGSTSISYSGASTSVPTTTTTYTSNTTSGTSGTSATTYSSSNPSGNVTRRVISTRVISHPYTPSDGTVIRQINNNSSQSISSTSSSSSSNPVTTYTTYYRAPSSTTTPVISSQTGNTYTTYTSYQSPSQNSVGGASYDEDPELQAALLASLGYHDQNSPALYSEVQRQHQLYKQFNKK